CLRRLSGSLYFFFQAEDGIRDFHVTGVQTCALPICAAIEDCCHLLHVLELEVLRIVEVDVRARYAVEHEREGPGRTGVGDELCVARRGRHRLDGKSRCQRCARGCVATGHVTTVGPRQGLTRSNSCSTMEVWKR